MKGMLKQLWLLVANQLFNYRGKGGFSTFKALQVNDGADKLEQTMKGVSAVIDILRDRVLKLVVP
jgi:hypothetical protein